MQESELFKALANPKRLQILHWLKDPRAHFPPQRDGDLVDDGVCAVFLAEKLGVGASTLSEHMRLLVQTGLVDAKPIKQWTFYRRNPERAEEVAKLLGERL